MSYVPQRTLMTPTQTQMDNNNNNTFVMFAVNDSNGKTASQHTAEHTTTSNRLHAHSVIKRSLDHRKEQVTDHKIIISLIPSETELRQASINDICRWIKGALIGEYKPARIGED